ncbi:MAG TPA: response regulator [Bryobacteraceae bacterium]|nr:response regulator [Bryobacteraceae bacterium]
MDKNHPKQLNLLLVEDSPADVYLVQEAIRQEGLDVQMQVIQDGEQALALLDRIEEAGAPCPSAFLLDLNLPRKTGQEILGKMRSGERCGKIPVLVITSSDAPGDRKRAMDLGAADYFVKPSRLDEFMSLGKIVRSVCEKASGVAA